MPHSVRHSWKTNKETIKQTIKETANKQEKQANKQQKKGGISLPILDLPNQKLHFNQISGWFLCSRKSEKLILQLKYTLKKQSPGIGNSHVPWHFSWGRAAVRPRPSSSLALECCTFCSTLLTHVCLLPPCGSPTGVGWPAGSDGLDSFCGAPAQHLWMTTPTVLRQNRGRTWMTEIAKRKKPYFLRSEKKKSEVTQSCPSLCNPYGL